LSFLLRLWNKEIEFFFLTFWDGWSTRVKEFKHLTVYLNVSNSTITQSYMSVDKNIVVLS